MSKKEFTYRQRLRRMDYKKVQALDKLAVKIGLIVGAWIILIGLMFSIIRG